MLPDEVHILSAPLMAEPGHFEHCFGLLSAEEHARADRIASSRRKHEFVVGRGILRQVLGQYLGIAPRVLLLQTGQHGKPALVPADGTASVRFNLSHVSAKLVIAIALDREVGVDLEKLRTDIDHERLVSCYFSPAERAEYASLPSDQRPAAFWRGWVRKEAYLKARGLGLTLPLDRFDVSLSPDAPVLLGGGEAVEASRWYLRDLDLEPGYVGALAFETQEPPALRWHHLVGPNWLE